MWRTALFVVYTLFFMNNKNSVGYFWALRNFTCYIFKGFRKSLVVWFRRETDLGGHTGWTIKVLRPASKNGDPGIYDTLVLTEKW